MGNYGVPGEELDEYGLPKYFESDQIHVAGVIVADYSYEYSDNVEEGKIISQDVLPGTILKKIDKVSFVVSGGPNYDKEIILTNFEGTKIDELIDFISKNYLNNVMRNINIVKN